MAWKCSPVIGTWRGRKTSFCRVNSHQLLICHFNTCTHTHTLSAHTLAIFHTSSLLSFFLCTCYIFFIIILLVPFVSVKFFDIMSVASAWLFARQTERWMGGVWGELVWGLQVSPYKSRIQCAVPFAHNRAQHLSVRTWMCLDIEARVNAPMRDPLNLATALFLQLWCVIHTVAEATAFSTFSSTLG